ncbi:hypothetical protein [Pseudorhodobacter ferrugineus]|uniref:hypothetical protein n=1 Tax=Pseudorhodobacter ferrugineus TaxID=77008 RepID=UPI0003B3BF7A|nr:hypothetical protein [Pseudorhodobacter ferrugineus]
MSQHEIEDLIEETARLILTTDQSRAEKCAWIGDLYALQSWFDTSETTGRLQAELQELGYFTAPPRPSPALLPLAAQVMQVAETASRPDLVYDWLALTVDALDSFGLGPDMPPTFDAMLAGGSGPQIRAVADRCDTLKKRPRAALMQLQTWAWLKNGYSALDAETLDLRLILRFFSDPKTTPETLLAAHAKEMAQIAALADLPLFTLPERVQARTDLVYLGMEHKRHYRRFVFATTALAPAPTGYRLFFVIEHNANINFLSCEVRVQSGALLAWQGTTTPDQIAATHFRLNYIHLIHDDALQADALYDAFGGWNFKLTQSAKVLDVRLDAILSHWACTEPMRRFHAVPLPEHLAKSTPDAMEKQRKTLRGSVGFFMNDIELLFAYACIDWEKGNRPDAMIAQIRAALDNVHSDYPAKPDWVTALAALEHGASYPQSPPMIMPYRNLGDG